MPEIITLKTEKNGEIKQYPNVVGNQQNSLQLLKDNVNNNYKNEVLQINYYIGMATMIITYNVENKPILITMNYISPVRPTKKLAFTYFNRYFSKMTGT